MQANSFIGPRLGPLGSGADKGRARADHHSAAAAVKYSKNEKASEHFYSEA